MSEDYSLPNAMISTKLSSGHKALMIRKKYGVLGHAMIYEVICWITAHENGWFVPWNDETADQFATTRMYDLSVAEKAQEILLYMVEIGFFSTAAFRQHKVLTSPKLYFFWKDAKEGYARKHKKNVRNYIDECVPEGTKPWAIRETLAAENPDDFAQNPDDFAQNPDDFAQNADKTQENADFFGQSKVKKGTKTNKQTNAEEFPEETPAESAQIPPDCGILPADPEPKRRREELPAGAREPSTPHRATSGSERHRHDSLREESPAGAAGPDCGILPQRVAEVRLKIVRAIYEVGLSADLVDAMTHAALNRWINVPQVEAWRRKAREETELYRASKGRAGKAKAWAVYRPLLEAVYLAHGATLPPCSAKRKEPPPIPAGAGADGATDAGRRVR
ncbi:MAG: DUF4373 domain-containing protein [Thermoguttaceae bacterium]|nr:DUF4373 domain-containing protein [Thermoguttaceae bacterium]